MSGLCIDTVTLEYCLAESTKTADIISHDTLVVFLGEYLSEIYKYMYQKTYTVMFSALFTVNQNWKQFKHPSTVEWIVF